MRAPSGDSRHAATCPHSSLGVVQQLVPTRTRIPALPPELPVASATSNSTLTCGLATSSGHVRVPKQASAACTSTGPRTACARRASSAGEVVAVELLERQPEELM